jgi:membrane protein
MAKEGSRFKLLLTRVRGLLDDTALHSGGQLTKLQHFVHFWSLVWRSFTRNRCPMRATALAYGTLLALIPMLAVAVSVSTSFLKKEGEDSINQFILKMVASVTPGVPDNVAADQKTLTNATARASASADTNAPQSDGPPGRPSNPASPAETGAMGGNAPPNPTALPQDGQAQEALLARRAIAHQIHDFIQNTRRTALGLTGSVLLIFAGISMLTQIETTFNDIWGAARGRSWPMRVVLYWGVLSLAPLVLVVVVGLATGPHLEWTKRLLAGAPFLGRLIFHVLPVVVLCLSFSLFYALMPNTRVGWRAALAGGLAGGLLFHLNNLISVLYVSRVVTNSRIYGSLGLVVVFMIGLYFAWWILLFGAQVAYAYQNRTAYLEEKQVESVNQRGREFIALRLMTSIGERFERGERQPSVTEMAQRLSVPTRLAQQILQTLCAARLVVETSGADVGYMPARPLEAITCHDVLLALRASQGQELATRDEPARVEIYGEYQRIEAAEQQAASSVTMLALVQRARAKQLADKSVDEAGG